MGTVVLTIIFFLINKSECFINRMKLYPIGSIIIGSKLYPYGWIIDPADTILLRGIHLSRGWVSFYHLRIIFAHRSNLPSLTNRSHEFSWTYSWWVLRSSTLFFLFFGFFFAFLNIFQHKLQGIKEFFIFRILSQEPFFNGEPPFIDHGHLVVNGI